MESIILTNDISDGYRLQADLIQQAPELKGILCYVKKDILKCENAFKDVESIFSTWYMPSFTEEEISCYFPSLRAVYYAAGSIDYFAEPFLKKGIRVFSASKNNALSVAEYVAAQIVLANKGYYLAQHSYKSILWKMHFRRTRNYAESHYGNYGAQIGLIGFGAIGRQVTRLLLPYHLKIVAYDPFVPDAIFAELNVTRMDISELFRSSDVISNHLPDIPSTRGLLDKSLFTLMKDSATFINTGRGAQVIERDLSKAIRKRKNACAVLDVTQHEPVFPWSPLLWNRKIFITPHIAGSLSNEYKRLSDEMVKVFRGVKSGVENGYEVTL